MKYVTCCGLILGLLALAPGGAATAQTQPNPAPAPAAAAPVSDTYQVGAGDLLAISVYKEPELSRVLPVRPDGNLSLPLIGEIKVAGFTAAQLQTTVNELYAKYVANPAVTVMVQEARSKRFNVVGEVERPGSFILAQPTTVLDSLALASGFRSFAKTKRIYVLRTLPNGSVTRLPFDYTRVIKGQSSEQNILLQPGDTVVVP